MMERNKRRMGREEEYSIMNDGSNGKEGRDQRRIEDKIRI